MGGTASQVDAGTSSTSDSTSPKAKAKAKAVAKTAPKVYAAQSTVASFACMFVSRPLRSQGVAAVPHGGELGCVGWDLMSSFIGWTIRLE